MDWSELKWEEHRKAGLLILAAPGRPGLQPCLGKRGLTHGKYTVIRVSIFVAKDISFAFLLFSGSHFC